MYRYQDIKSVHMEITTRCNASCPQCSRNIAGGRVNPALPLVELEIAEIEQILPVSFLRQLDYLQICGNYGDPMVARDTLKAFNYFRRANPAIRLAMHTNGSGRTAGWWQSLAQVIDVCHFGIDGLEDTNHLYRRGTNWSKVMDSAESFINAGGKAKWTFIVFRHNEHEVEQAAALAEKMGFSEFTVKRTKRFFQGGRLQEKLQVLDRDGHPEYELEPPRNSIWQNTPANDLAERIAHGMDYDQWLAETEIDCQAARKKKVYLTAEGLIFPCCYLAGNLYSPGASRPKQQLWDLLNGLDAGIQAINAKHQTLQDIVEGPVFQNLIPAGWHKSSAGTNRLMVCARVCGQCDMVGRQKPRSIREMTGVA